MHGPKQASHPIHRHGRSHVRYQAAAERNRTMTGPGNSKPNPPGIELRQRLDQVGTILAKGLDLAEAGVSLGVTIIGRVGVAASQKIREGIDAAAAANAAPDAGTQTRTQPVAEAELSPPNRKPPSELPTGCR